MKRQTNSKGILWTGIEKVLVYGVTFVQGVILARLLGPEDFGLTAMLGIFLGLGGILAESGLGTALVVYGNELKLRGGQRRLNRMVFKWNVGMALGVYVILAIAAPGIAAWYQQPILRELAWVMGLGLVVNAACVVGVARLQSEQRFAELSIVNTIATIGSFAVGIACAWLGCGVWAIVILALVHGGVRLSGLGILAAKGEIAEPIERADDVWRKLLSYGWKLTVSGLVHVIYTESYNLIIGKMWNPTAVGLFARGQRWAKLPGEVVNESVGRVALPALTQREGVGRWMWLNCALLWPGLAVLCIWAEEIVGVVLGAQWLDCVPYLRILIVGQFFTPISVIAIKKIQASGRAEVLLKTDVVKKPIGIAALICGSMFGVVGLCWAKVVDDIVEAVVDVWYTSEGSRD